MVTKQLFIKFHHLITKLYFSFNSKQNEQVRQIYMEVIIFYKNLSNHQYRQYITVTDFSLMYTLSYKNAVETLNWSIHE